MGFISKRNLFGGVSLKTVSNFSKQSKSKAIYKDLLKGLFLKQVTSRLFFVAVMVFTLLSNFSSADLLKDLSQFFRKNGQIGRLYYDQTREEFVILTEGQTLLGQRKEFKGSGKTLAEALDQIDPFGERSELVLEEWNEFNTQNYIRILPRLMETYGYHIHLLPRISPSTQALGTDTSSQGDVWVQLEIEPVKLEFEQIRGESVSEENFELEKKPIGPTFSHAFIELCKSQEFLDHFKTRQAHVDLLRERVTQGSFRKFQSASSSGCTTNQDKSISGAILSEMASSAMSAAKAVGNWALDRLY